MTEDGDWNLVRRAQAGETAAFATLVRRYQAPVVRFCERMTGSLSDAEDIAQEAFVRMYRHLPKLEERAKFSTLLFGITRNLTLNYLRDDSRRGRGRSIPAELAPLEARPSQQPMHQARQGEMQEILQRALARLSSAHREILLLREVEGMEYDAIAQTLQCERGTVKSRLARAREQLRLAIIEMGGNPL
jgi:RNA polymerase sigma factor (sigma-70 family)